MRRRHTILITLLLLVLLVSGTGLSQGAQKPPTRQEQLNQALVDAVDGNDVAAVRRLLRQGADPNARVVVAPHFDLRREKAELPGDDKVATRGYLSSVLMRAVAWRALQDYTYVVPYGYSDNASIVEALVDAGADVNERVLSPFLDYRWFDIKSPKTTALIEAAYHSKWKVMQVLLSHHADVNVADDCGDTALMYTARNWFEGGARMVKRLLERGASVDAQDDSGETALLWVFDFEQDERHGSRSSDRVISVSGTMKETVALLLKHGASVTVKNNKDVSVMELAAPYCQNDKQLMQMLKRAGVKQKNKQL